LEIHKFISIVIQTIKAHCDEMRVETKEGEET